MAKNKKKWYVTPLKVLGVVGAVAGILGIAYLATRPSDDEDNMDYIPTWGGDKEGETDLRFKYDNSWIESASLEELQEARQEVQDDYRNPELDNDYRGDLWDLLLEFDTAIGEKQWEGKEYRGPAHREHGWYLPNDD